MNLDDNDYITIGNDYRSLYKITSGPVSKNYRPRPNHTFIMLSEFTESLDTVYHEVQYIDTFHDYEELCFEWPHSELSDFGDDVFKLEP